MRPDSCLDAADDGGAGGEVLRHVRGAFLEVARLGVGPSGRVGVAGGNGVRGEQDMHGSIRGAGRGELGADVGQAGGGAFNKGLHKARVVEVLAHLVHLEPAVQAGFGQCHADVLAVLAAAGVTGVGTRGDHQQPAVAGVVRVLQRLRDVGVPVAVAPEHRQPDAAGGELGFQGSLELAVLLVDGADAAVGPVVVGDLFEPLVGDAAAAGDVAEERNDVILALGPAEGGEQDGVVVLGRHPAGFGDGVDGGQRGARLGSAGFMRGPLRSPPH